MSGGHISIYGIQYEDGYMDDGPTLLKFFFSDKANAEIAAGRLFTRELHRRYTDRVNTFGRERVDQEVMSPGNLIASFKPVEVWLDADIDDILAGEELLP
jgi:hypothetical protein